MSEEAILEALRHKRKRRSKYGRRIHGKINQSEHQIQAGVVWWARAMERRHPELRWLHAIPNGGARTPITGALLKASGVRRGVPDLCLPVPRGQYHGLYMELKRPKGRTTKEQHEWLEGLFKMGYQVELCTSVIEATQRLLSYLKQPAKVVEEVS